MDLAEEKIWGAIVCIIQNNLMTFGSSYTLDKRLAEMAVLELALLLSHSD